MEILADRVDRIACGKCGKVLDTSGLPSFSSINCPHCGTPQKVPAILGNFLLAEQMGAGGMGAVYRAVDQALGRFVAIKVMKQQLGVDRELVESFLREARAAAALNHPNIVQIYSCGQEKGQPYIVMELVGGGRLEQMMENGRKVDEVRLLEVALDVAEGLKAADGADLVHGDIKPANILFDQRGTAKVVDFGLAQFVNRQQEQGGVWGTPYYISPERARGGKADHRSDIYSLGATMFHALTGQPPFEGKTATDVVVARLKAPPPKIRDLEPSLQPQTAALIERMMAADPVLRYPTSASLLADMRAALQAAREARVPGAARTQKKKPRPVGLWVVGIVIGLLVALAILLSLQARRAEPPVQPVAKPPPAKPTNVVAQAPGTALPTVAGPVFSGAPEAALVQALSLLTGRPPAEVTAALAGLAPQVPREFAALAWFRILKAVPQWLGGEARLADADLADLAKKAETRTSEPHEWMPLALARFLTEPAYERTFDDMRTNWPAWYGDLSKGLRGFRWIATGDLPGAMEILRPYTESAGKEPAWAYALQAPARWWMERMVECEKEQQRLWALVEGGDLTAARRGLEMAVAQGPAAFQPVWDKVRARISKEEERLAAEARARKKAEEEAQRQVLVQEELQTVEAFMATNTHYTGVATNYIRLKPVLLEFARELKQPESRQRVEALNEHLDRMEGLKKLLIAEVVANPYKGPGWQAVGANVRGMRIAREGFTKTFTWDQVSPATIAKLVSYYADAKGAEEKADIYLSLAVFGRYNNLPGEDVDRYLQSAKEPGGAPEKNARRLLPEPSSAP